MHGGLAQTAPKGKRAAPLSGWSAPGFAVGNGLFTDLGAFGHNDGPAWVYKHVMDPMFAIPKDRKRSSVLRLCLVMGMTALLFIVVSDRLGSAAEAVLTAPNF